MLSGRQRATVNDLLLCEQAVLARIADLNEHNLLPRGDLTMSYTGSSVTLRTPLSADVAAGRHNLVHYVQEMGRNVGTFESFPMLPDLYGA